MNTRRLSAIIFRLVLAAASLAAMSYQLFAIHIPHGYSIFNFFCYFTNLSNILISLVFIVSALRLISSSKKASASDTAIRGGAVVYIAFVGLVFNTLLRNTNLGDLNPVVNLIVHFALPVAGLVDWIIWPPKNRLPFSTTLWWMIFPAAYSIFSLVRGALTDFYPYPFLSPVKGGYGTVAVYCLVMLVGFFALASLVRFLGNWRRA